MRPGSVGPRILYSNMRAERTNWGGGQGDHDFLTIWPTPGCHGHVYFLTMIMAEILKCQWSNCQDLDS